MQTIIQNASLKAVIKHKGAELSSLEKDGENYIWDIDTRFWDKTSPVLFPVIGALKNEEFEYDEKKYTLPRHGFAREKEFEIISKTEDSVVFSLKYDEETMEIYPFLFELQIAYRIENSELFVKYTVVNLDQKKLYYSIGAHPAFKIEGNFEEYSLQFDSNETLVTHKLDNNLFNGKTVDVPLKNSFLLLSYQLFENDAIVLKNYTTTSLQLLYYNQPKFKVKFSDFPYLGIWTKKDAPFICIEPWRGIADNTTASGKIEEKEGIEIVEIHSKKSFEWSIEVF